MPQTRMEFCHPTAVPGMFIQHFDVSSILDWAETMNRGSDARIQSGGSGAQFGGTRLIWGIPVE